MIKSEAAMLDIPNRADQARHLTAGRTRSERVLHARLQIVSDLHLDCGHNAMPRLASGVDAVVVAGNTAPGAATAFALLRAAFPRPVPLVVVLGNREYHGTSISRERRTARMLAPEYDILLLDDTVEMVAGIRFVGGTLWTDYLLGGALSQPEVMFSASTEIEDHGRIARLCNPWLEFSPYDALAQNHATRRFLRTVFSDSYRFTTVVVTHHAPSRRSLNSTKTGGLDGSLASELDGLVIGSGASLWIHGLTHSACDYLLGDTRVVSNPRGRRESANGFDPTLVVEVPCLAGSHLTE